MLGLTGNFVKRGPWFESVSDIIYFFQLSVGWIGICDGEYLCEIELNCWKLGVIFGRRHFAK